MADLPDDGEFPTAKEVVFRLGGGHRLMPLPGVLNDLYDLVMDILVLDQRCADCESGVHPALHSGLSGILNSLGWLLGEASDAEVVGGSGDGDFLDRSAIRRAATAALPAFAHLIYISESGDLYRELGAHHPEFRNLIDMLDQWLPLGGSFRAKLKDLPGSLNP